MLHPSALLLIAALQQGFSSPATGDTSGYWQQRVTYTITASLDEPAQRVRSRGTMRYVNNSPDTLREMYLHQYLNAFRPGSKWSAADEREGRERFQRLPDPEYGYERFTGPVRVNGQPVAVEYPGSPDSTVARFKLPAPLLPGDSLLVAFEWDARPSTVPRRQGRRGRHWDLAQWYPKVAVYDRGGWQHNALQPAGEFYGEFGTYDVTLVLPQDQIIGATGVPVSGDPGWTRAKRAGTVYNASRAYGDVEPLPAPVVPPGHKAVRFFARDVHHFAWSASPDYRYEGAVHVRSLPNTRWDAWDTVAVHALYRPADDSSWGGMRVVQRTINAMQWLESIYGPYAHPQMTVLHRLDGGGTEFPMLQMNGSPSQGLILHEGGHVWTYGILANNEWRSGWMDEGLTSYQTDWAQGFTPQERVRAGTVDQFRRAPGYRARAVTLAASRFDAIGLQRTITDLNAEAQPIGTVAHRFRDFGTYNDMIYSRAQVMYGQLRDALGDTLWAGFLDDYYARWALKHVDERAMRGSAERVLGGNLGWFFDQWVHRTGVMDYALGNVRSRVASEGFVTEATVARRGQYRHPISVGVRTRSGWRTARLPDPLSDRQIVQITTPDEPLEVRLDPHHFSWDWNRRNDVERSRPRVNVDWPLLRQADRDRSVLLIRPMAWYSDPGGATIGMRARASYLGLVDQWELGVVHAARSGISSSSALQYWARIENPYLPFFSRPAMGWSATAAKLDDVFHTALSYRRERERPRRTDVTTYTVSFSEAVAADLLPERWTMPGVTDLELQRRTRLERGWGYWFGEGSGAAGAYTFDAYLKIEAALGAVLEAGENTSIGIRGYAGSYHGAPVGQRLLHLSAADALSTFDSHWYRPRGAILKQDGVNFLPLGGAALRGYGWALTAKALAGANVDVGYRLPRPRDPTAIQLRLHSFADAARVREARSQWLSDAGVGLSARGRLYDRDFAVRLDSPFYVSDPALAIDRGRAGAGRFAPRWVLSFNDIW